MSSSVAPVPARLRRALALAASALAVLVLAPSALAATRQVAPGAADTGECLVAACGSLGYAYARAGAGDVVQVAGGAYPDQTLPAGATPVTIRAAAGATPVIAELTSSVSNATVQGLTLRRLAITGGSRSVYEGLNVDGRFAKRVTLETSGGSTDITVRNSSVGNVTDEKGALVGDGRLTIDGVDFHDVRVTGPEVHNECVFASGAEGLTIRNSTFQRCATMDLFFTNWSGGPAYGNVTLENNVFAHSTMEGVASWHYYSVNVHSVVGQLRNWTVRNNTFEIPFDAGVSSGSGRWVGNLGDWKCISGFAYRANVGKACGGGADKAVSPASSTASRTAALGWLDPARVDFRLRPGSPAIDAADPKDAPALDRNGYQRDARPDAGAHEFGAGPPAGPVGGAPGSGQPGGTAGSPRTAALSARLMRRTICRRARRTCPASVKLRLEVAGAARVRVQVDRLRRGKAPSRRRAFEMDVAGTRTVRIRARGLAAGRYRVVARSRDASGATTGRKTLTLLVRR